MFRNVETLWGSPRLTGRWYLLAQMGSTAPPTGRTSVCGCYSDGLAGWQSLCLSASGVLPVNRCGQNAGVQHPSALIPAVRRNSGIDSLPLTEADALAAEKLQLFHKDPFDRMLIAQALMGGLAIVTCDSAFEPYPVRLIW